MAASRRPGCTGGLPGDVSEGEASGGPGALQEQLGDRPHQVAWTDGHLQHEIGVEGIGPRHEAGGYGAQRDDREARGGRVFLECVACGVDQAGRRHGAKQYETGPAEAREVEHVRGTEGVDYRVPVGFEGACEDVGRVGVEARDEDSGSECRRKGFRGRRTYDMHGVWDGRGGVVRGGHERIPKVPKIPLRGPRVQPCDFPRGGDRPWRSMDSSTELPRGACWGVYALRGPSFPPREIVLEQVIQAAVQRGACDIHVKAGDFVRGRIEGDLVAVSRQRISPEQVRTFVLTVLPTDRVREQIDVMQDFDCSWGMTGVGRFRVNIMRQRGSFNVALRMVPSEVPTLESLGLPPEVGELALQRRGLLVVAGPEVAGRSWAMAALVRHINHSARRLVVTLEDPIEFLHRDAESSIIQREIGADTETLAVGLRAALRHGPDVIQIAEVREAETVETVLKAAEAGHLVIFGLDTLDAETAVRKLVQPFPAEAQIVVRQRLAAALLAVVCLRSEEAAEEMLLSASVVRNDAEFAQRIRNPASKEEFGGR